MSKASGYMSEKPTMGQRFKQFFVDFARQWEIQSMIWPGVIFMFIFCYIPIYGLTIAFKRYTVIDRLDTAPWVAFENFEIIMKDKFFLGIGRQYTWDQLFEASNWIYRSDYFGNYDLRS